MASIRLDGPRTGTITVRGGELTVRLNPPVSILEDIESGSIARIRGALEAIVIAHPFVIEDFDGAGNKREVVAVVRDFDRDLARDILKAWGEAVKELPPGSGAPSS